MTPTALSPTGTAFLIYEEGRRLKKYLDSAGLPTIGIGHLLTAGELASGVIVIHGESVPWRRGITRAQCDALFGQDVRFFERAVRELVLVPLSANQFDALVSFTYNIGTGRGATSGGLKNSTLLRLLNAGDYAAPVRELPRWKRSGGKIDPVLVARRKREVALWKNAY